MSRRAVARGDQDGVVTPPGASCVYRMILSDRRATFRPCPRSRAHRAPPPPGRLLVGRLPPPGAQVPPRTPNPRSRHGGTLGSIPVRTGPPVVSQGLQLCADVPRCPSDTSRCAPDHGGVLEE